jgi:hypothetical protein
MSDRIISSIKVQQPPDCVELGEKNSQLLVSRLTGHVEASTQSGVKACLPTLVRIEIAPGRASEILGAMLHVIDSFL